LPLSLHRFDLCFDSPVDFDLSSVGWPYAAWSRLIKLLAGLIALELFPRNILCAQGLVLHTVQPEIRILVYGALVPYALYDGDRPEEFFH